MGEHVANVELTAHGQPSPSGEEGQSIRLHLGDQGVDLIADIDVLTWAAMRAATQIDDRTGVEALAAGCVTPPGGWSPAWRDALWRAANRAWG